MGTCLSKKKDSSTATFSLAQTKSTTTTSVEFEWKKNSSQNGITVFNPKVETKPELKVKKENDKRALQKHDDKGQVKKEIFIIKHRKSHDEAAEEDVDAILVHCGRLSRNSSGKASSFKDQRRRFSGSNRSNDFDDNDTVFSEKDQKISDLHEDDWREPAEKLQFQSPRSLSQDGNRRTRRRRRTPSREREQGQCSSGMERRFSISPVRRSSDTTTSHNVRNNNSTSSKPAKMVSVPATVTSLVMDKSNNNDCGGEAAAATTGIKRITVRRNVGAASPRSQSPAKANGNAGNQQQQLSLSRNSSRKKDESPYRRNPLSELESNSIAIPQSTTNYNNSRMQSRSNMEDETGSKQKPNASRIALDKGADVNCKTKIKQDEDVKVMSSVTDNVVVKTVVPPVVENLQPQILTRSRSSRRSRDLELDLNPEDLLIPPQSYTSLLLEDIQNFHQKNTPPPPPVSLPACVARACSILEAVANLNSNTSSNLSGVEDRRSPSGFQSRRNEYNVSLRTSNSYGKRVADAKDSIVESELIAYDELLEPSLHKFETMNTGGPNMEKQESSGNSSLSVSSAKHRRDISSSSSSWEPSSTESKDCWTARLNNCIDKDQKTSLGLEGSVSPVAGRANVDGAKKKVKSTRREYDHQRDNETGHGRLGTSNFFHMKPVVTAAAST